MNRKDLDSRMNSNLLLEYILEKLACFNAEEDSIQPIIKKIALFFDMDVAFVYLHDHMRGTGFYLYTSAVLVNNHQMPIQLDGDLLPTNTLPKDDLYSGLMFKDELERRMMERLGAKEIICLPVVDENRPVGIVGCMNLGKHATMPADRQTVLKTCLALIAAKAQAIYFKQQKYRARASLEKAVDHTRVKIYATDYYTNEVIYVNKSMAGPYGVENMLGKICWQAIYNDRTEECDYCPKYKLLDSDGKPTQIYTWEYHRPFDGSWFRVYSSAYEWEEGTLAHVLASVDITETKQNGLMLSQMALSSGHLKMPNRRGFEKEQALRQAVQDGFREFYLLYHPIVDLKTEKWVGAEILSRWNSPQFGLVPPNEFIPLCEHLGLIYDFEKWVIDTVMRESGEWAIENNFFLSINISHHEFGSRNFSDFIVKLVDEYHIPMSRLVLEISSSHYTHDDTQHQIRMLRSHGVLTALDHFGISAVSVENLQDMNVDFIKVDRDVILGFLQDDLKTTVVKAFVMIARSAGVKITAEGVENQEQLRVLREIGMDYVQGVYFLEPVNSTLFGKALKRKML